MVESPLSGKRFITKMEENYQDALLEHLLMFITPERNALFDKVLQNRTRHVAVVLEDIYQSQNASAVLRSCDLTGIQDVHIIENNYEYAVNPDVALGSSKWLNLIKYNEYPENTLLAFENLRKKGYRIIATTPHRNEQLLDEINLQGKLAVVFGTELTGLSEEAIENADEYLRIPMYGFTESYNISVSAALILYNLMDRLRQSDIDWRFSPKEIREIKLEWARRTISRSDVIERQFLKRYKSK